MLVKHKKVGKLCWKCGCRRRSVSETLLVDMGHDGAASSGHEGVISYNLVLHVTDVATGEHSGNIQIDWLYNSKQLFCNLQ